MTKARLFHNGHSHQYHFDGGYISFSADTVDGFHYYIQDYMGNNRMVVNGRTDSIEQVTHYYPYGGVIGDNSTNESMQPYKFEGKELDRTFGLDNYDIEARQYFAMAPMWDRVDPLAEKYYGISPYVYCGGDPVTLQDINGKNPIYDVNGNFLGTDDKGLQGSYLVMDKDQFVQGMSNEEALKFSTSDIDDEITKTIENHYNQLSSRPDWDGELTLNEANEWFRNGNGEPLFIAAAKVDLSNYVSLGDEYIGNTYFFNTLFTSKHGRIFGHLGFKRVPDDRVIIFKDTYDFDIKKGSKYTFRNIFTEIGAWYAGDGKPYEINFWGTNKLRKR